MSLAMAPAGGYAARHGNGTAPGGRMALEASEAATVGAAGEADAGRHLRRRLAETPMIHDPFPYRVISGALPDALYRAALAHWPGHEQMRPRQFDRPNRLQMALDARGLASLPPDSAAVWREVLDALAGPESMAALFAAFPEAEARWHISGGHPPDLDARLIEDHAGHAMRPHTDLPVTLYSLLLYLPDDDTQPHLGTTLYRPRDPGMRSDGMSHHDRDLFEIAGQAPYLPNHLLAYARTDRSFHGVEPVPSPCTRRLLMVFPSVDTRRRGAWAY